MEEHKQTFSTAIKLLHSKHKDSGDNLLRLVDDLIQKRYGEDRSVMKVLKEKPHLLGHGQGFQGAKEEEEEDKKPPPAGPGSSEPPPPVVYLDRGTSSSSPGVISIPDEPSSSLLELERDFEASVSGLDAALPLPEGKPVVTEADTEASSAKLPKPGRGRKKRLATPAKRERSSSANILDEVLTLMDKSNGKVAVKPPATTTAEGVPAVRAPSCSLCSDGEMAKAVTCRRCQQTFLLCCVEMSAPGFDPGAWLCGYCLLRCRQSTDPQLWSCPLPSSASFRKVTAEEDATADPKAGEELRDRTGGGKRQKQSSSPEKLRRGTRLRKYL